MFIKGIKILILSAIVSATAAVSSFAAVGSASAFPYSLEFDVESLDRVCYAGHPGNTVVYKDGIAVTPDTSFRIESKSNGPEGSEVKDLSVTVSLVYENNDHSGSYKEVVKHYDKGDLNLEDDFRIISDNAAASLESRDKLYSDSLTGFEMTLQNNSRDIKKKTYYLYMCSDDDFDKLANQ